MGTTVVFKGGSMDGTEISYETCCMPGDGETTIIRSGVNENGPIGFWLGKKNEVYVYICTLNSWVYDHESEVVEVSEEDE